MKVSEVLALPDQALRRPVDISGYLIVSSHLCYIVEEKAMASASSVPRIWDRTR